MSRDTGLAVIGAGGHAAVVVATLQAAGERVDALFDDDEGKWGTEVLGVRVAGSLERLLESGPRRAILAIGDNRSRLRLAAELDLEWATAVHPAAWVHESVDLGAGTVVLAGAMIQPGTVIGPHVIVNTGATIDHDCRIAAAAHLAPGCHLAGLVTVGEGALLGVGCSVIPGRSIGDWATVGAGAAVVRDIPGGVTARGVPALW